MKPKSVAGLWLRVNDFNLSLKFYETLGFDFKRVEDKRATGYINWFWIEIMEAPSYAQDSTSFLYISVDNVDETYRYLKSKGLKTITEPQDYEKQRREFMLEDPDGYKIVIFKKK